MEFTTLWIYIIIATVSSLPLWIKDYEKREDQIGRMTREIVDKYFTDSTCVGVIMEYGDLLQHITTVQPTVIFKVSTELLDKELTCNKKTPFSNTMVEFLNQGCLSFVMQVRNPQFFVECFYILSRRSQVRSNRRYLYLPNHEENRTLTFNTSTIFNMKEMDVMPDLIIANFAVYEEEQDPGNRNYPNFREENGVLHQLNSNSSHISCNDNQEDCYGIIKTDSAKDLCQKQNEIDLITHKFVGWDSSSEIMLDTWTCENCFLKNVDLYASKMKNLEGKMVTVAAVPSYPPYTIVDTNSTPPVYDGIELRFVKEYGRHLNFSFSVVVDDTWWGEVWPNGSGIGMWGNVAMDVAFMGFGATYAWLESYPYLDYSLPYFRSSVRILTPLPKQLPGWMTPILPFNSVMWVAVGISMLITAAGLYFVTRAITFFLGFPLNHHFSTVADCVLRSFGLLLFQSPDEERSPQYVPLRHLLAWLMVYFLLINSIYSGGLSSVLTVPRFEHPINTIGDLVRSEMIWAAPIEAWVFSIQEATEPDLAYLTHKFRVFSEPVLLHHAIKADLGLAVERLLGGNYALPSYVNKKTVANLRAMRNDLYSGSPVFNVRKASPFLESLNTLVLQMHAGGILLNYEEQVVREFLSQRVQLVLAQNDQPSSDTGPVKLQTEHIQGPLFFLGFGLLAATIIFIMEIIKKSTLLTKKKVYHSK